MHLSTLFNIISLAALVVVGGVSAQDENPTFFTKCATPGQVALTFDDGPSQFTPTLLGHLAKENVTATFFVLTVSNDEFGKNMKQAFDAGHQIALHSSTHADMNKLAPSAILEEYTKNLASVKSIIGLSPATARPPFGNCNPACAKVLQDQMKLNVVQWNCDSNDWQYEGKVADQPKLFSNMQAIINPSNPKTDSFITLQHDIKDYSVAYVPQIIKMIKDKGYTFVTVEKCIGKQAYVESAVAKGAPATAKTVPAPAKAAPAPAASSPAVKAAAAPAAAPPAAAAYPSNAPAPAPAKAAFAEASKTPSASSANKFTSSFGSTLAGLILGFLMY
uniref:Putative polysaccharide deacetylase yheN n=1 Tax=Anthurium amnicola TaxID=1678845 RepID=A0A1D1ZEV8_9ARAE